VNSNTFFIMILIIWILAMLYILYSIYMKKDKSKPVEPLKAEIRVFHIFPDYPKDRPLECKQKNILRFIAKGYTDEIGMREVEINFEEIVWKFTKGNGELIKHKDYINFITPEIKGNEKLIFISAHYLGLTDATWIKVKLGAPR